MPKLSQIYLTEALCRVAGPIDGKDAAYIDRRTRGLEFRVRRSGLKVWSFRAQISGKHKRIYLGQYPAMNLSQAREAAEACRASTKRERRTTMSQPIPRSPDDRIICEDERLRLTRLSRATWHRLEKIGDVPPHIQLSPRRRGWWISDITSWVASRQVAR